MTKIELGSVSEGTMREEDLIPTFLDVLAELAPDKTRELIAAELENDDSALSGTPDDYGLADNELDGYGYFLETLFDALEELSPDGIYFGAHDGDGADYGFWIADEYQTALWQYAARRARREHPEGQFDKAGRWHPSDSERQPCCSSIRQPSKRYPHSLLKHCRSLGHVARLNDVDPGTLASLWRQYRSEFEIAAPAAEPASIFNNDGLDPLWWIGRAAS